VKAVVRDALRCCIADATTATGSRQQLARSSQPSGSGVGGGGGIFEN